VAESTPLSESDRARLRAVVGGQDCDPDRPLFAVDSATWRVQREAALLLAGGRALLLQVAHPLVAAGVAAHSDFEARPLDRLRRTLELTLEVVFAPAGDALRAVQAIEAVHDRVRGRLEASIGPFAESTPYDADQPPLLWWVYATLLDSSVVGYRRFVGPLDEATCEALYRESAVASRLFGIPDAVRPPDWPSFQRWFGQEVERLVVGDQGRAVAEAVLSPSLPWGLTAFSGVLRFASLALLPPSLREQYGVMASPRADRRLEQLARLSRAVCMLLPGPVRRFPRARRALRSARSGRTPAAGNT